MTNREDLIQSYLRMSESSAGYRLEVCMIVWNGPHQPQASWRLIHTWINKPSAEELGRFQQKVLADRAYFGLCTMCARGMPHGHMHNAQVCQGCAARHLGIVY